MRKRVFLGQGIPLSKDLKKTAALKLVENHVFSSGVACLHYEFQRDA
ncbi:MAG TPA: hypothetical protein VFA47_00505 [Candidatus Manganitrophaceae bacterium]|nr:hypothetical protein [Candidatus Manganitrophaceae bacterium]